MEEVWKPVVGFEGRYEVSDQGRVRSLDYIRPHSSGKAMERRKGKILTPHEQAGRYLFVPIYKDGKRFQVTIHRLVAMAFLPASTKTHVNHIDHDRQNNVPSNLEWVTPKENTAAAIAAGKFAIAHINGRTLAINNPKRSKKLTAADVAAIRDACKTGEYQWQIAQRFGIQQSTVSAIHLGKTWSSTPKIKCGGWQMLKVQLNGQWFTAIEAKKNDCKGCMFVNGKHRECMEAGHAAQAAGMPDCEDLSADGNTFIYVVEGVDARQPDLLAEGVGE